MRIVSGPNTLLLEITEVIPPALPTAGDACFAAEVSSGGFSGRGSSWVEALALDGFLTALRSLEHTRKGEAQMESMSPGELRLRVYSLDSLGHIALSGRIAERNNAVEFQFELDPSYLSQIAGALERSRCALPPDKSLERTRDR
jgi:hypothetical protein